MAPKSCTDSDADDDPLLGVALDVALDAPIVRYLGVHSDLGGTVDDLRQSHLGSLDWVRLVTRLTAQPAVGRLLKSLEGLFHQVARQTEVVVVLDVVVGPVGDDAPAAGHEGNQDTQPRQGGNRGGAEEVPQCTIET